MDFAFECAEEMQRAVDRLGAWDGFARHERGRFLVRLALAPTAATGDANPESVLGALPDTVENAGILHEMGIRVRF